jgi:exodeoxyribonuclease VII small subunit
MYAHGAPTKMPTKKNTFENQIEALEDIVEKMENDEASLEESLKLFEKGISLTKSCHKTLQTAEQKVKTLSNNTTPKEEEINEQD